MDGTTSMWVDGANGLTARWVAALDGERDVVVSGACVWPLLALLASGADGDGRDELDAAIGISGDDGVDAAIELVSVVRASPCASAAMGMWVTERIGLRPEWASRLPAGIVEALTGDATVDQDAVDRWASEQTDGIIDSCPVSVGPATEVVLMSAMLVRATWVQRFVDGNGQWTSGRGGSALSVPCLSQSTHDLRTAAVIEHGAGVYGRFVCAGTDDIDVHLVSGDLDSTAAQVVAAGIAAIGAPHLAVLARDLPVGTVAGCLQIGEVSGPDGRDDLVVRLPRFDLAAKHDLLQLADIFGLRTVSDAGRGHIPGIADGPLAVGAAAQRIRASFSREGFVAAAVTAMAMLSGAVMPTESHRHRRIAVIHDRPFGFLAVHRPTGLVLVAGWVVDPEGSPAG